MEKESENERERAGENGRERASENGMQRAEGERGLEWGDGSGENGRERMSENREQSGGENSRESGLSIGGRVQGKKRREREREEESGFWEEKQKK